MNDTDIIKTVDALITQHSAMDDFFDVDENLIPELHYYFNKNNIAYEFLRCGNIYSLVGWDNNDIVFHYLFRVGHIEEDRRNV